MKQKNLKSIALIYLQMIPVWMLAVLLFMFLRNFGVEEEASEKLIRGLDPKHFLLVNILIGVVAGILYTTIELIYERPFFQKEAYWRIILSKLVLSFFSVKIMMALGILLATVFRGIFLEPSEVISILHSKMYWVVFVFFMLVAGAISFVRMVSQKFGPGVLWNLFIGKYRNPREERRVFMFLDLKSSTTIAERLGHIKFSRFIQNCFADLTPVITKHKVQIYQYVGDEAVLSWPLEDGFEENHCIHCYYDYMEVLKAKSAYYKEEYGIEPIFKAGVHLGKVIVAEVGLIKREIAYHGDVLNTTARIQGKCNDLEQHLLISDDLLGYLQPDDEIQSNWMGEELLKGKEKAVTIYGISKKEAFGKNG